LQVVEGTPDSINDAFVYNEFHRTLILAAMTPLAMFPSTDGVVKLAKYFSAPPDDINIVQWIILKE